MKQTRLWLATIAALLCSLTASAATITFADWTSTNKTNNSISSKTYRFFTADEGGTLSFSWSVSSETDYDKLIVTLDGTTILEKSGSQSGNYSNVISQGSHTLVVKYTKDSSESYGYDRAIVSNIVITGVSDVIDGLVYLTSGTTASVSVAIDTVAIAIPSSVTIDGNVYVVNAIGDNAFYGCSSLTSVTIPESVTSIGNQAFDGCTSLKDVIFEDGSETLTLGYKLYSSSGTGSGLFYDCPLETIYLGRSLSYNGGSKYGYSPFYNQDKLASVIIGDGVTSIGEGAFEDCSSLTSITIPASVKSIGDFAFGGCDNLKFLVCLALTPPTLGEAVFASEDLGEIEPMLSVPMESLTDYRDADGWRYLPCTNTMILYISTSRGSWAIEQGGDALKSNSDLGIRTTADDSRQQFAIISHIDEDGEVSYYLYHPAEKKFVNKDGGLGYYAAHPVYFKKGAYANTYVVYFDESHYINIGGSNQMIISSWSTIDAGNSCTIVAVEEYDLTEALDLLPFVLDGCSYGKTSADEVKLVSASQALNKLEIPATIMFKGKNYSVTSIGDHAFESCSSLTSVIIPEGVTSIGDAVFQHCSNLTAINIPEGVTDIGDLAFKNCSSLTTITLPEGVTRIGDQAFVNCTSLASINIPEGVTDIGDLAFKNCSSLTTITLPEGVTRIGGQVFMVCSSLTSITIPEGVTSIGGRTFYGCSSLTSITIPSSVTSIGNYAFDDCSSLTSITLPESVTSIGNYAFDGCTSLKEVIFEDGSEALTLGYNYYSSSGTTGEGLFYDCPLEEVYLGRSLSYNEGSNYGYSPFYRSDREPSIALGNDIESIPPFLFYNNKSLTSITLPESVTSIGGAAFYNCSSLTSITLPEGVTSIGSSAFNGCSGLTAITIPSSVTSIGTHAFGDCSSLTSITLPESVTSIGENAFSNCSSLRRVTLNCPNVGNHFSSLVAIEEVVFGNSVISIEDNAFSDCSGITSIVIPESVTSVGSNAFSGCSGLKSLFVGTNVDTYGENVFEGCTAVEELTVMGSVMPMVPSDKFTTIRMFSPGPLDTEEFDAKVYRTATLYVPEGSLARYQMADVWKKFWYIEEFDPNEAFNVTLDRTTVTMTEGDVITLVATIIPQYIKDKTVTWTTSDAAIATVDNGVVTAVAEGTATITAKAGDKEATCVVTVEKKVIAVSGITLDQTEATLTEGETLTLTATVTPDNATDKTVTWSSSNTSVATVDEHGVVTAVAEGTATITATAGDKTATCTVTVAKKEDENAGVGQLTMDKGQLTIYDLQGRKVENPAKGIYIINGRKVVIK